MILTTSEMKEKFGGIVLEVAESNLDLRVTSLTMTLTIPESIDDSVSKVRLLISARLSSRYKISFQFFRF